VVDEPLAPATAVVDVLAEVLLVGTTIVGAG
jgi:hypothetical protein